MSISQSLNNAVSGLTATSRMAEVVSSNLSNALTEGYARRVLETSSASIGGHGIGVRIVGIQRITDAGIIADRRLADADVASAERQSTAATKLEVLFSAPDDPSGLSTRLAALEGAIISATADPASDQRLGSVLLRLSDVADALNDDATELQAMRQEADAAIAGDVDILNTALQQVEVLNADISRARGMGVDPSGLIDERQRVVDTISEIVPVRELSRANDQIAVMTTTGAILVDGPAVQFDFDETPTITSDMTLSSGGLSGITRDGIPINVSDGFGKLSGGSLSAAFVLRDQVLVSAQKGLDNIAADLIGRFVDPAVDPSLTAGSPGLLTDSGTTHDPADIIGLSRRITVNAQIDPASGGALWRIRDGVGAMTPGPAGDAAQLDRWGEGLRQLKSSGAGMPALSAAGQVDRVASQFGAARLRADEGLAFSAARRDTLFQAELSNGVDTDQELQSLLQIEQAYAANAKLMQTINAMIQTLMEL